MQADPAIIHEFAPGGRLRAALNLGNPVLAASRTSTETPAGVTIDLSREFARHLGVEVVFNCFGTAGESVAAVASEAADIGFMAIDPKRADGIHFTAPYVQIEGSYLVPDDSPIRINDEVDKPGNQVVVGHASAYDLFLTRHLKHARLVRVPLSAQVVDAMLQDRIGVAAGVRQQLEALAQRIAGVRLLDGGFMVINQAAAMPSRRSAAARACLDAFIERMKSSGFVAQALARHGIEGASVAPAA